MSQAARHYYRIADAHGNRHGENDLREFLCGWGAGFINTTLTFPINKIMFRQMLHGVKTQYAVEMLKREGLRYLYRGYLPPMIQKTISVSIMFGTYQKYGSFLCRTFPDVPKQASLALAAFLAGSTEALLAPLERVQTLLQHSRYHTEFRNTFHAFRTIGRHRYGAREYYRGLTPIVMRNGLSNVLFFKLRNSVKDSLPEVDEWWAQMLENFISGAVVGAFISTVFYPVNVAKTKMQVHLGTPFLSFSQALRLTYIERGRSVGKLFFGVHVNFTRALLSWGIINASYEMLKKYL